VFEKYFSSPGMCQGSLPRLPMPKSLDTARIALNFTFDIYLIMPRLF